MNKALVFGLIAVAGCSSVPTEPHPTQEWVTLEEYKAKPPGQWVLLHPVVTVPEGTEVVLRISKKPTELLGDQLDLILYEMLEPVEEQMVTVKLRAKKTVHLDMDHLLASTDKKTWMPLGNLFFPLGRETRVTVASGGGQPKVIVPVWTTFENLSLTRDVLSDLQRR